MTESTSVRSQRITRNAFSSAAQKGYNKPLADPAAFVALPSGIADEIGFWTHKGARIDAACLSRLLFSHQKHGPGEQLLEFHGLGSVSVPDREFILSVQTIAEDLWARWFHLPADSKDFLKFYERTRKAVERLETMKLVTRVAPVGGEDTRTFGSFWTFDGTPLEDQHGFPRLPYTRLTIMRRTARSQDLGTDLVNAVDLIGSAFVEENFEVFTRGEMISSLESNRGYYTDYLRWVDAVAKGGTRDERFVTAGAYRPEDVNRYNAPSFFYWIVLDIDRDHPLEAFEAALRLVDTLGWFGADLTKIIVSFTGGKGFHIRIPSGMFGNPVFATGDEAIKVLKRFALDELDEDVDPALFNPRQPIRLVGSRRSENGFYTRAWDADVFQSLSFEDCYYAVQQFEAFAFADPRDVEPVSALVDALVIASDITRRVPMPVYHETKAWDGETGESAVIEKAKLGCAEGEEWFSDGRRSHQGRSKLLFIAACAFMREFDGDEHTAWQALQVVNQKCDPPMRDHELRGRLVSARRRIAREGVR